MATILCIGVFPYDVAPLITVAREVHQRLGLEPIFLSAGGPTAIASVREQGSSVGFATIEHQLMAPADDSIRNPFRRARRQLRATHRLMDELLSVVRPDAVLASVNCQPGLFLDEAARRGIPTVLLQLFHWGDRAFYHQLWADERRHAEASMGRRRRLRLRVNDRVNALYDLGPAIAWDLRRATIAVQGPALRQRLIAQGVPSTNVISTGNPSVDDLYRLRQLPEPVRAGIRNQLGISVQDTLITHLRSYEDRLATLAAVDREASQTQIVRALRTAAPEASVVVKIHPREGDSEKQLVRSVDPTLTVVGEEVPTNALIAASDLVVSTSSTTLLHSVLLDRPTVSAWFWPGHDYLRRITNWSGVERLSSPAALANSVRMNLTDAAHREVWQARRAAFVNDEFLFDGLGTTRVADLIEQMIACRGETSARSRTHAAPEANHAS